MSRDLQFLALAQGARALAEASREHPSQPQPGPAPEGRGDTAARAARKVVAQARLRGTPVPGDPGQE